MHRVPGRHQGLRGDEYGLCDVFPEGSARALHGGRERARLGRAGGDRVPGGGGVEQELPPVTSRSPFGSTSTYRCRQSRPPEWTRTAASDRRETSPVGCPRLPC